MSRFDDIVALFTSPAIDGILADVMNEVLDAGGMTPTIVKHAGEMLPLEYGPLRSLVLDVAVGTLRADRLGKGLEGWFFTNVGAEQATHPLIAAHHASRFVGLNHVLEICAGAGMDALALSRVVGRVTAYETDEVVAALTTANLLRNGVANVQLIQSSWTLQGIGIPADQGFDAVWADPSRRTSSGGRIYDSASYSPPLRDILAAVSAYEGREGKEMVVGVKTGPGDLIVADITGMASEYIGFRSECRERVVWKGTDLPTVLVTLVDANAVWSPVLTNAARYDVDVSDESYIIEPHSAVIASGYVEHFLHDVGMPALDPHIAYGLSESEPPASPFYDRFAIHRMDEGVSEKKIKKRLAALQWGRRTEFKKRGWPGDPEQLRSLLPETEYQDHGVVFIARRDPGHVTIYAKRL